MPMASTPAALPSAATLAPITSWGVPYDWSTKEEKTSAWFTDGSAHRGGATHKWTATALQLHSGKNPERYW